ncbi:energy transducer TonB family protein [Paraherbaspirillum soli]|uniref:Energy transducer TonB n=1 Tax=Paraherbaspirillum soli TaxID=631222 RepID=A0ABW0M659_9BURK
MPILYRFRDAVAALPSLLLLAILVFAGIQKAVKIQPHNDDTMVQLTLQEPETMPVPQPAPPTPPEPVKPRVIQPAVQPVQQPRPAAPAQPQAVTATPSSSNEAEVAPPVKAAPAAPPAPATPAPPPAAPKASVDPSLEKAYYGKLRAEVERQKVYPRSREAALEQPQGKVVVWLEIGRSGEVLGSGIETPASSMLLNRAAEASLRRLKQVEKFPAEAFAGVDKKRFTVTFTYSSNTTGEQHESQGE